jgi:DNA polymerase I-like protein with 3'-5' exonuclease and polymerase domains
MLRGLRVDGLSRDAAVDHLRGQIARLQANLNKYAWAAGLMNLNPNSPAQLKHLFYEVMALPPHYAIVKGEKKLSTNRESLEKLSVYFHAKPFISSILAIRDLSKQVTFLTADVDEDSRLRTSYNVAGTETGRWSSSTNAFGSGTNLQNFPEKLRSVFIADPGRKLAYCDLEQAESWIVGIKLWELFADDRYICAIEEGDLHTSVARMVWRNLPWTGDIKQDRQIAERVFYRDETYRQMAKRGGHGTNYYGKPVTMAKHLKVPVKLMEDFQNAYLPAFGLSRWHSWVAMQLQLNQQLTTLLGRTRHFFGRPNDDVTLREAIAFEPQSVVGDLLNLALYRVWLARPLGVRVLAQLHDAILIDYPDDGRDGEVREAVSSLMKVPLHARGREFTIGTDFACGWNWGKWSTKNPGGLKKWTTASEQGRLRPAMSGLDRVIPSFH